MIHVICNYLISTLCTYTELSLNTIHRSLSPSSKSRFSTTSDGTVILLLDPRMVIAVSVIEITLSKSIFIVNFPRDKMGIITFISCYFFNNYWIFLILNYGIKL